MADDWALVPEDTLHKGTSRPPFGTWGSLTLDISIASYLITSFSSLFFLFHSTNKPQGRGQRHGLGMTNAVTETNIGETGELSISRVGD